MSDINDFVIEDGVLTRYTGAGGDVVIPDGVTSIGNNVFYNRYNITSITIPDSVTSIGNSAFNGCWDLTSINIPDSVTSIGNLAFASCTKLTSFTIPDSVTFIGARVFAGSSMDSITIPGSVTSLIGQTFTDGYVKNVILSHGVQSIGAQAFLGSYVESVTIPDSVTTIEYGAFMSCQYLKSITIPGSVTSFGNFVFVGCTRLENVILSDGVNNLGSTMFDVCPNLKSITIPGSAISTGFYTFSGSSLENIILLDGVQSITSDTAADCTSLKSITIPDSVTSIGNAAFVNCSSLDNVTIPGSVVTIGDTAFAGCSNLKNLTISDGVKNISSAAFGQCTSLERVEIPESVGSIGGTAFADCSNIEIIYVDNYRANVRGSAAAPWGATNARVIWRDDICKVTFIDWDGEILKEDIVFIGDAAVPPENDPIRADWLFLGWDKPYDIIQEDTNIYAVYTQDYYIVQFVAWNGDVLKTENVISGFPAHPPQDAPAREGWVFTGWDKPYDNIQEDTVIHATYGHDQYFTVTFRGYDGKVLKKELAYRGSNATPPGRLPRRPGYHFAGWSGSYKNIQGDTTLWALYEPGEDGDKPKRIKIEFDTQLTPLQPRMLLATRSGSILGELPINHVHFTDDLGSGSEIAFQVYKERCLDENDEINEKFWRKIESMRLGYCPEFDEWYELDVEFTDSSEKVKSVTAVSLGEAELSQIRVYNIEINSDVDIARDDYAPTTLYNRVDKSCSLIDRLLYKAPHYTVKHVDDSIADLQRTFQFSDRSVYDCFQDIGKEIGCLFRVECRKEDDQNIVREISVYDLWCQCLNCGARGEFTEKCNKCGSTDIKPGYGEDTTIYVDKDNLADKVVFSTDIDSIKNCFRLSAGDDLMTSVIVSCNPNGSQYMWYIPEYMQEDMSDKLRGRLNEYNRLFDYYQKEYRLAATPMIPDEF